MKENDYLQQVANLAGLRHYPQHRHGARNRVAPWAHAITTHDHRIDPVQGILRLFDFVHGHFGDHPELIHLLSGENLLQARFLRHSIATPIVASPLIELISSLLRRGQRTGVIRRGIDPLHLYVIMVALSYFHRSNAHTLSAIFRTTCTRPRGRQSTSGPPPTCWRAT